MGIGIIDFILVAVIGGVAWCVAAEGAVGAGTTFFCVVFSGLLAMNFFEPLAAAIAGLAGSERADMIALLGLLAVFIAVSRLGAEHLTPTFIPLQGLAYDGGRWTFGVLTGYVMAAILLTAVHVGPFPREFWGFRPERANLFDAAAPDRQWLGFTQYVTEKPLVRWQNIPDPDTGEVVQMRRIFDGRTAWHYGLPDQRNSFGDPVPSKDILLPSFLARYADRRSNLSGGMTEELGPQTFEPAAPTGGPAF